EDDIMANFGEFPKNESLKNAVIDWFWEELILKGEIDCGFLSNMIKGIREDVNSTSVLSIVSSPSAEELSPTQSTCPLVAKDTFILHPRGYTATPLLSHIIPDQVQLTSLHMSPMSMQSQSKPTSPICKQSNQYESRKILPKIEAKPKEMSQEYIQYERERRRNYARLLREKKRARVKELEDRAAFLEKENK
ncbi:12610_t:CDS:2, partial [Dentiscutata heterogama]